MGNHSVVAKVTPNPTAPNGTGFDWSYSVDGESFSDDPSPIHVPHGDNPTIAVSVVAGGLPGDICVFQGEPLRFKEVIDGEEVEIPPPGWYQPLDTLGPSAMTFVDDNTNNANPEAKTYHIRISMKYTSNNNTVAKTSPDPTIVNDGVNFTTVPSSQESPELAASAV